ncbi:hypothetical protein SAMN05192553_11067 [Cyclobacterium xiamenense]|uniref:Tetratricopeptide repeat-containing protein n=1 Tax=Cyclobacterium xiamenense TaxID=1297121 RepID=A0A1H7B936_9BACT|nr:hypothetical protein [Cyclobacterium xiamenense]SEJ73666.1 hypothetical protein SAMN05192553_11067 [Cyclobacterium xiamenense]
MEKKYDDPYLVEYLDGNLTSDEKELFEKELERDPSLRDRVNLYRYTLRAIKSNGYETSIKEIQHDFLKQRIENKDFTSISTPKLENKVRPLHFWGRIAASVALLGTLGYGFFLLQNDGNQLFEANYLSYEITADRGVAEQENLLESLYLKGDFKNMFQAIEGSEPEAYSSMELLLLGAAALELNQPSEALRYLQTLEAENARNETDNFQDEADFYMALAYLKQEAYEDALRQIKKINDDDQHKYHSSFSWAEVLSVRLQTLR